MRSRCPQHWGPGPKLCSSDTYECQVGQGAGKGVMLTLMTTADMMTRKKEDKEERHKRKEEIIENRILEKTDFVMSLY